MAAQGYPESYEKGTAIRGLDLAAGNSDDVKIFHAGTKKGPGGDILANGGRVLNVTALAPTIKEAQALAYTAVDKIGSASSRERACQYVQVSVVAVSLKNHTKTTIDNSEMRSSTASTSKTTITCTSKYICYL